MERFIPPMEQMDIPFPDSSKKTNIEESENLVHTLTPKKIHDINRDYLKSLKSEEGFPFPDYLEAQKYILDTLEDNRKNGHVPEDLMLKKIGAALKRSVNWISMIRDLSPEVLSIMGVSDKDDGRIGYVLARELSSFPKEKQEVLAKIVFGEKKSEAFYKIKAFKDGLLLLKKIFNQKCKEVKANSLIDRVSEELRNSRPNKIPNDIWLAVIKSEEKNLDSILRSLISAKKEKIRSKGLKVSEKRPLVYKK